MHSYSKFAYEGEIRICEVRKQGDICKCLDINRNCPYDFDITSDVYNEAIDNNKNKTQKKLITIGQVVPKLRS